MNLGQIDGFGVNLCLELFQSAAIFDLSPSSCSWRRWLSPVAPGAIKQTLRLGSCFDMSAI